MKLDKQKIEVLMVEKCLNYTKLAELTGISRQSLSTIKNRGSCQVGTALKLCKGLSCSIQEITPTESEV